MSIQEKGILNPGWRTHGIDMDSQENRGWQLNVVVVVFLSLSWLTVATRLYVRLILTKSFQIDDWLMLIALVSTVSADRYDKN